MGGGRNFVKSNVRKRCFAPWIPEAIALIDMGWPTVIAVAEGRILHINPSKNEKRKEEEEERSEGVHLRLTLRLPFTEFLDNHERNIAWKK